MRLWSLWPGYLDSKGLVAAWREGLLALAVLAGKTRGYRAHPQLDRFRSAADPAGSLRVYLEALAAEADSRGYRFARERIAANGPETGVNPAAGSLSAPGVSVAIPVAEAIPVTEGQIAYEGALLLRKLSARAPGLAPALAEAIRSGLRLNPAFRSGPGGIEEWERPLPEILREIDIGLTVPPGEGPT